LVIHTVFFWLANPDSAEDFDQLKSGLLALKDTGLANSINVGIPAANEPRSVLDKSYSIASNLVFKTVEDEMAYQIHPLHQKFISECKHLWKDVKVYDVETFE
jgi:hypothetical protein